MIKVTAKVVEQIKAKAKLTFVTFDCPLNKVFINGEEVEEVQAGRNVFVDVKNLNDEFVGAYDFDDKVHYVGNSLVSFLSDNTEFGQLSLFAEANAALSLIYDDSTHPVATLMGNVITIQKPEPVCPSISVAVSGNQTPDQFAPTTYTAVTTGDVQPPLNHMWIIIDSGGNFIDAVNTGTNNQLTYEFQTAGIFTVRCNVTQADGFIWNFGDLAITVQQTQAAEAFEALKARADAEDITLQNEDVILEFFQALQANGYLSIVQSNGVFATAKSGRFTTDTLNLNYVLDWFNAENDLRQTSGSNQPTVGMRNGLPTFNFTDPSQSLRFFDEGLDFMRNVPYGRLMLGTNVTTGTAPSLFGWSNNSAGGVRLILLGSSSLLRSAFRRLDGDTFFSQDYSRPTGWKVIEAEANYQTGDRKSYIDGVEVASDSGVQGTGNTSNTRSNNGGIGNLIGASTTTHQQAWYFAMNIEPPAGLYDFVRTFWETKYGI